MNLTKSIKAIASLSLLASVLLLPTETAPLQEKAAYAIKRYKVQDKSIKDFPDDYVLEFLIPANSSHRVEASGEKERNVLSRSTISPPLNEGKNKRIVVTTGGKARYLARYFGSLDEWANSVTVSYSLIEPRGPGRPPVRPRG